MNNNIKTISLDDIGSPQPGDNTQAQQKTFVFNPNYVPSFGASEGTREDTVSRAFEETNGKGSSLGSNVTGFTALLGEKFSNQAMGRKIAIVTATLAALGAAVYFYLDSEGYFETVNVTMVEPTERRAPLPKRVEPVETAPAVPVAPAPKELTAEQLANPYWPLPNPPLGNAASGDAAPSMQESWRYGLTHPYVYQRYKTVKAIRDSRGSDGLLRDALSQPKFWTRMEAVLGLAEQGEAISPESLKAVFDGVRADLPRNYFRRFHSKSTEASMYVMRQAVRVVDARVREIIIQNLALHRGPSNDLYLYAATHDPSPVIKGFAEEQVRKKSLAPGVEQEFQRAMTEGPQMTAAPEAPKPEAKVSVPRDLKVEKLPAPTNVEEVYFLNEESAPTEATEAPTPSSSHDDGFETLDATESSK